MKTHWWSLSVICLLQFLCGCSGIYSCWRIDVPQDKLVNPAPMKFHIVSISGGFVQQPESEKIIRALNRKYPEFFTPEKKKGVNIDFSWNYGQFVTANTGSAVLCGLTFGLIPCISKTEKPLTLNARCQLMGMNSGAGWNSPGALHYSAYETQLIHIPSAILGLLVNPLWIACISAGGDLETPYVSNVKESLQIPFKYAQCNLSLFPLACAKMYNSLTDKQKTFLKDIYSPEKVILLSN